MIRAVQGPCQLGLKRKFLDLGVRCRCVVAKLVQLGCHVLGWTRDVVRPEISGRSYKRQSFEIPSWLVPISPQTVRLRPSGILQRGRMTEKILGD